MAERVIALKAFDFRLRIFEALFNDGIDDNREIDKKTRFRLAIDKPIILPS